MTIAAKSLTLLVLGLLSQSALAVSPYYGQIHPAYRLPPASAFYPPPTYAYRVTPTRYAWPAPPQGHQPRYQAAPVAASPSAPVTKEAGKAAGATQTHETTASTPPSQGKASTKQAFLKELRPLVETENRRLRSQRQRMLSLISRLEAKEDLASQDAQWLRALARKYRIEDNPLTREKARAALQRKVDVIPVSLALAQAANESAWGRSRFAKIGNNLFGIWTYDESKGIVPLKRAAGKKHLVRKFESVAESVRYYLFTLNSHPAYRELRDIRAEMRARNEPLDGWEIAKGLSKYSAKGQDYVRAIQQMIRRFDLAAYDDPSRAKG